MYWRWCNVSVLFDCIIFRGVRTSYRLFYFLYTVLLEKHRVFGFFFSDWRIDGLSSPFCTIFVHGEQRQIKKRVIARGRKQLRGGTGRLCSWVHVSSSARSSGITELPREPSLSYSARLNSQSDFVFVLGCYLLSERCHVLSQASSHITHQPPLWVCPYFFLHSQPQLTALKRTQVLGNQKCCVSLKIINSPQKRSDSLFFFWWQVGFPEKRPFIVVVAITWTDKSSRGISLRFRDAKEHRYLFCSASDCMTGSWSVSHIEQGLQKNFFACLVSDSNLQTVHHKSCFWLQAWNPFKYKLVVFWYFK